MNPDNPPTPELKMQAALEAIRGEKTLREIATEYGVTPAQVVHWKKTLLENAASVFESKRGRKAADPRDAVIERLDKTVKKRRSEIDWLKNVFKRVGIEVTPEDDKKRV